jgi:hypothetical protein
MTTSTWVESDSALPCSKGQHFSAEPINSAVLLPTRVPGRLPARMRCLGADHAVSAYWHYYF